MQTHSLVSSLSDELLITRTKSLVQRERSTIAELVLHLAEIEARQLHLAEGCSSLFGYCTQVLHLSEYEAYTRIAAARAGRRFPLVFEYLALGDVHLSAVDLLAPHLTKENHVALLERARHRSKRGVEKIVAEIAPRPEVTALVRRLPARTGGCLDAGAAGPLWMGPEGADVTRTETVGPAEAGSVSEAADTARELPPRDPESAAVAYPAARSARPRVEPLSPERYKVQFTADSETVALLRRAQDLLRHQVPDGDPAVVIRKALAELVRRLEKQKAARVDRPRDHTAAQPRCNTRHNRTITASIRRIVWNRDGGRCAYRGRNDRRCTETGRLEFHHVKPFAHGGQATADNIELRCRAHNQYEAIQVFGDRSALRVREKRPGYWVRTQSESTFTAISVSNSDPVGSTLRRGSLFSCPRPDPIWLR